MTYVSHSKDMMIPMLAGVTLTDDKIMMTAIILPLGIDGIANVLSKVNILQIDLIAFQMQNEDSCILIYAYTSYKCIFYCQIKKPGQTCL